MVMTLQDVLIRAAASEKGICVITGSNDEFISYQELLQRSLGLLYRIQHNGLLPRQEVIIFMENPMDLITSFWACVMGGFIPVPLTASTNMEHLNKLNSVYQVLDKPVLITDLKEEDVLLATFSSDAAIRLLSFRELIHFEHEGVVHKAEEQDIAFVQFSSGSTGDPKGVMLTHGNLLANISAIMSGMGCDENGKTLNWMPFTHDMGLIGGHLTPITACSNQYQMATTLFIRRPALWLKKASEYGIHYLSSPNFGYGYVLDFIKDRDLDGVDLSGVKLIFNGAEPISTSLCERFMEHLQPYGLKLDVWFPVYGMAEASLAVTFPHIGDGLQTVHADRRTLTKGKRVSVVPAGSPHSTILADEGFPVTDCEVRICDDDDRPVSEWTVGSIHIRGANVTAGYYNNESATKKVITEDGWLRTGDLGFIHEGRLVVTGREKEILFVHGQNIYPSDIESIGEQAAAIKPGRLVACGIPNEHSEDDLILFLYDPKKDWDSFIPRALLLSQAIKEQAGLLVKEVIPIRRIPKTTSGKVQRFKLVADYQKGSFDKVRQELREQWQLRKGEVREPQTSMEAKVLALLNELGGAAEAVMVTESLRDAGIDSLKATYLAAAISEKLKLELPVSVLLKMDTIEAVAAYLEHTAVQTKVSVIPSINDTVVPVLANQRKLFVLEQLEGAGMSNHVTVSLRIPPEYSFDRMNAALQELVSCHEALRSSFSIIGNELMMRVHEHAVVEIEAIEPVSGIGDAVMSWIRPFNLEIAPLWRTGYLEGEDGERTIVFDFHHIIVDGTSIMQLLGDFFGVLEGKAITQPVVQYRDLCSWYAKRESSGELSVQETYWVKQFEGDIPVLELPTDKPRHTTNFFQGDAVHFEIDANLTQQLRRLAAETDSTMYILLLTAYYVMLAAYSDQNDIVIGSPFANRSHPDIRHTVGMLINTLPIRIRGEHSASFLSMVESVRTIVWNVIDNQSYYSEQLVNLLSIQPELNRNALYDTVFNMQNMTLPDLLCRSGAEMVVLPHRTAKVDLTLECIELDGILRFTLEYSTDLFHRSTIERMSAHYRNILQTIVVDSNISLNQIDLMDEEERMLIQTFQQTYVGDLPRHSFLELFCAQARLYPKRTALYLDGGEVTYRDLEFMSNRLAWDLIGKGVGKEKVVGVLAPSGLGQIVALLGIMKAGGACLPIDPAYPAERIRYMLDDCSPELLVADYTWNGSLTFNGEVLDLLPYMNEFPPCLSEHNLLPAAFPVPAPGDLAIILYTSGTTGNPKGIMLEYGNLTTYLDAFQREFDIQADDVVLQQASFSFDIFIEEVMSALAHGAALVVMKKEDLLNLELLQQRLQEKRVSVISGSSLLISEINKIPLPASLRLIISGGDILSPDYISNLSKQCAVYNTYGPTETTICASYYRCDGNGDRVSIGKPIAHYKIYIKDNAGRTVPIGVHGQLYVAGPGVTRGYFGKPELTGQRFTVDKFIEGERVYMTGDLARWLPDGNIDYLGRADRQVKIRGYRIELDEAEQAVKQCSAVIDARIVAVSERTGELSLCAYIIVNKPWTAAELRIELSKRVPDYIIPSYFVEIDRFPVTTQGKIDVKRLPSPRRAFEEEQGYEAPEDIVEERLVAIWCELLELPRVGVTDHFFGIGGHSLKAAILAARIKKEFGCSVPVRQIFAEPTIRQLSEHIRKNHIDASDMSMIPIVDRMLKELPASSAQSRIFVLHHMEPNSTAYNISRAMVIEDEIDVDRLQEAFQKLTDRHESLRTSFTFIKGEVMQRIHNSQSFDFQVKQVEEGQLPERINEYIRPFDLGNPGQARAVLFKVGGNRSVLLVDMHHIITDATSVSILMEELQHYYASEEALLPVYRQYRDYAIWHRALLESDRMAASESYWLGQFDEQPPVLELPTDYQRPHVNRYNGDTWTFTADKLLTSQLQELAQRTGTTMYMVLLAAYFVLLQNYSGQDDFVVGTPVSGRTHADTEGIVGMFINTLPIRLQPKQELSFGELLNETRTAVLHAVDAQDYPFDLLVDKLRLPRNTNRNPLFDTVFVMQNTAAPALQSNKLRMHNYPLRLRTAMFDLTLECTEHEGRLEFSLEYSTDLFRTETIQRMVGHYIYLLNQIAVYLDTPLNRMDLLTNQEKQLLKQWGNGALVDVPHVTLAELFAIQAHKLPDRPAVELDDRGYTYAELDKLTDALANELRTAGVSRGSVVGVYIGRSPEQIAVLIAIWKAGGAYLPLDSDYPAARIDYMLRDCNPVLLLTDRELPISAPEGMLVWEIEELIKKLPFEPAPIKFISQPEDLAYLIYTSGTTGKPKGVMVEHRNVMNYVYAFQSEFALTGDDVVLQQASFSFDTFVEEVYPALIVGARIVMARKEEVKQPQLLARKLELSRISVITCSPLLLNELNKQHLPSSLRLAISGGDVLKKEYITNIKRHCTVYNSYGPTEATVCASYYQVLEDNGRIPIGLPIANYQLYVLDATDRPVPIGAVGQLCIGGGGVTRGYLGRPDLTADKFTRTMYRTGDLVRWRSEGQLEYMGRCDSQVNIRGYRIETEEIERVLLLHHAVDLVAVAALTDEDGHPYLCAYLVGNPSWSISDMRTFLSAHVPAYMIPSYFIGVDRLPLTTNGKLDVRSLPHPKTELGQRSEQVPARSPLDAALIEFWEDILGVSPIGIDDDFFELGGHSLKALELVNRIEQRLQLQIPVNSVFVRSRLRDLSDYLQSADAPARDKIGHAPLADSYALSSTQKRLYLIDQVQGPTTVYNMPAAFRISGALSLTRLKQAWQELIHRHESLRTSFISDGVEPRMIIHPHVTPVFDIAYPETGAITVDNLDQFVQPFNLSIAPLCRLCILPDKDDSFVVVIDMHHIVSDAVSVDVLFRELEALYCVEQLPPCKYQYKDYTTWQEAAVNDGRLQQQIDYWLWQLTGELPVLQFPTDFNRDAYAQLSEGRQLAVEIGEELSASVKKHASKLGVTPYMLLFAVYNVMLAKYSSQEDIIVGIPVVGRSRPEWQGVVGMFVNSLAIRSLPSGDILFTDYLQQVKETITNAFQYQDIPIEVLVDELNNQRERRDIQLRSLFTTMFSYREESAERTFIGLPVQDIPLQTQLSKFDFAMEMVLGSQGYTMELTYAAALFREETMLTFLHHFKHVLKSVVTEPTRQISKLSVMSREEALRQLKLFNPPPSDRKMVPIHQMIDQQARLTPDCVAVEYGRETLSYRQLNGLANSLSSQLRERGIGRGSYVPVWMDRSLELVVALLAIMKSGAAFVPMDPNWPSGRTVQIMEETGAPIVLTNGRYAEASLLPEQVKDDALPIYLDTLGLTNDDEQQEVRLEDTIYVIYTSGSTGRPKGVVVPHRGIANRFIWMNDYFGDNTAQSVLQTTHHVFDSSVWQLFWPLTRGGKTVLSDAERLLSADYIADTIEKHRVTLTDFVPSVFNVIVDQLMSGSGDTLQRLSSLKSVIVGGEEVAASSVHKFQRLLPHIQITNLYGPTEASIGCIYHQIRGDEIHRIPIGKPIDNVQIIILDENHQLVPPGVTGEIHISGLCLGTGYLNDKLKTEAAFLPHVYPETGWIRMYKTGDLARYKHNGVIEYLGRTDYQVKIRGLRIELGEIESQILHTGLVKEVVVTAPLVNNHPMLCAYIVADQDFISIDQLKQRLAATLPNYMIPAYSIQLQSMPLSPSGKVDRKALPEPDVHSFTNRIAPSGKGEHELLSIWREVLGFEDIGVTDDFFLLGGHSLKLFALASKIREHFGVQIPLKDLFQLPTIREQARIVTEERQPTAARLPELEYLPYPDGEEVLVVPASAAQKALFVIDNLEGISTSYNMPQLFEWVGPFDESRFRLAAEQLVKRHEALRTRFEMKNGEVRQIISRTCPVEMIQLEGDLGGLDAVMGLFVRPFDLTRGPLFRIGLLVEDQRVFIFMDMHHIISDGRSLAILIHDFQRLYNGDILPLLAAQYRHFAHWQQQMLESESGREHEAFWLQLFEPMANPLQLSADFDQPVAGRFEGDTVSYEFDETLSSKIRGMATRNDCTLYMVFLACYSVLLANYSGQDDIVIGTPVSGRTHTVFENTVGMFVNTVPFRNRLDMSLPFGTFLHQVRGNVLETLEYQNYPLEELVRKLPVARKGSGAVLFRTLLALEADNELEAPYLVQPVKLEGWKDRTVKFDLVLTIRDGKDRICADIQFATQLFAKETGELIAAHLRMVLEQVVDAETTPISAFSLLTPAEDHKQTAAHLLEMKANDFDF